MQIYDQILAALRAEYNLPRTYAQIHERSGVDTSHICALLNGRRPISKISLETLLRLFPRATISLDGPAAAEVNSHNVAGRDISIGAPSPASDDALRSRIIGALIRADLPADALKTALTIVQQTQ